MRVYSTFKNFTSLLMFWGYLIITLSENDKNFETSSDLVCTCSIFVTYPVLRNFESTPHPLLTPNKNVNHIVS